MKWLLLYFPYYNIGILKFIAHILYLLRIPQSLQHFGVFRYDKELMDYLLTEQLIEPGHRYEVEIRYGIFIQQEPA